MMSSVVMTQLDKDNTTWDRLYFFPPSSFAHTCIRQKAPDFDLSKHENYVFVVLLPKAA